MMSRSAVSLRRLRRIGRAAIFCLLASLAPSAGWAHGAWLGLPELQFTAATLATVDSNVQNGDTPVIVGDIVEIIAALDTIADGTPSGGGGWVTFYVPPGTQVVGAAMLDASLNPVPARDATSPVTGDGLPKGWGDGAGQLTFDVTANGWNPATPPPECAANGFTVADCNAGMAFLYGDTGIFYSTRADTAFYTGDGSSIARVTNGYRIKPSQAKPWGTVGGSGDARVHNKWDAVQSNAFGSNGPIANPGFTALENTNLAGGRGPTPYRAGSPVAGPDSASPLDRYGTVGPWRRISYPGSCIATNSAAQGPANGDGSVAPEPVSNSYPTTVCTPTSAGYALSEANPLPLAANNVRFAVGGIHEGGTSRVMLRLKILDPSVISVFNVAGSGGDASWSGNNKDNMWRYWVGAPATIPLGSQSFRLFLDKEIVAIDGKPYQPGMVALPGATIRYRISYANTGAFLQTDVVLRDVLPSQTVSTSNFTVVRGPDILPASAPSGGTFSFLTIPELPGLTGGAVEFDVTIAAQDGETVTNQAQLSSDELRTPLVDDVTLTVSSIIADIAVSKSVEVYDPDALGLAAIPGQDVIYTIEVSNFGTAVDASALEIIDAIPSQLTFFRGAFDETTTEPVKFVEGVNASGLICCGDTHITYSVDGGVTYNYIAPDGYDTTITHLKVVPEGVMGASDTSFAIKFRARIE